MNKVFTIINKSKIKLIAVLLMAIAGIASFEAYENHLNKTATYLPIENITIEGAFKNLKQSDMQNTVKSTLQGGFFTMDIAAIQHALLQLPWVDAVSIRRQWPASLSISVREKQAIAYWGEHQLLSDKGELFTPDSTLFESTIPYLDGPDNLHKTVWLFFKDTNKKIKEFDFMVTRLVLDKRRSWEMQLSNNVVVKLGRENTESRLQRFVKVFNLNNTPKMKNIESIDLRYPNGFAMRMKTTKPDAHQSTLVKEV